MDNVQDGDIILMHEIYDSTADAVERMVPELVKQGYKLVTCQELVRAKTGGDPQPGVEYSDKDIFRKTRRRTPQGCRLARTTTKYCGKQTAKIVCFLFEFSIRLCVFRLLARNQ